MDIFDIVPHLRLHLLIKQLVTVKLESGRFLFSLVTPLSSGSIEAENSSKRCVGIPGMTSLFKCSTL